MHSRYLLKRNKSICLHDLFTHVYNSSTIHNSPNLETTRLPINGCVGKELLWYVYAVEYYLASKRNKILIYATMWMNLKNTILNERNQAQILYIV